MEGKEALPARDGAGAVHLDVSLASFEVSRPEVSASSLAPFVLFYSFFVPICYAFWWAAAFPSEGARDGAGTVHLDVSLASFEVSRPEVSASSLAPLVSYAATGASPASRVEAEWAPSRQTAAWDRDWRLCSAERQPLLRRIAAGSGL